MSADVRFLFFSFDFIGDRRGKIKISQATCSPEPTRQGLNMTKMRIG
jgi:hypothetical protein